MSIQDFMETLNTTLILGWTLSGLIAVVMQPIKNRFFPEGGIPVRVTAVSIGTILGTALLFAVYPTGLDDVLGILFRIVAAFTWAWTAPLGYQFVKQTTEKAVHDHIESVEEMAIMGSSAFIEE
jgi:hypothetical protein